MHTIVHIYRSSASRNKQFHCRVFLFIWRTYTSNSRRDVSTIIGKAYEIDKSRLPESVQELYTRHNYNHRRVCFYFSSSLKMFYRRTVRIRPPPALQSYGERATLKVFTFIKETICIAANSQPNLLSMNNYFKNTFLLDQSDTHLFITAAQSQHGTAHD